VSSGPTTELNATAELWARLARPFDPAATAEALLGLPAEVIARLVGVLVATCAEAETLLASMPGTLRHLKTSIGANHERCVGGLRGPVQWSETIAAQASSLGNTDVYVCAAPHRAYDIDQNQVLVTALRAVARAGKSVDDAEDQVPGDAGVTRARDNARAARRHLDHRFLNQVRVAGRLSPRAVKRTRGGKSNQVYGPALAMLNRVAEPLTLEELLPYCDRRTRRQHELVLAVIQELERRGLRIPALRAESGSLFAGPVEYRHPRQRGDRTGIHGVIVGDLLVDIPEQLEQTDRAAAQDQLDQRMGGRRRTLIVMDLAEIPAVVDRAITTARRL
jgi:hypothetical protein